METQSAQNKESEFILITGAAGFIGSCLVQFLNEKGYENLILVDDFGVEKKRKNWESKKYDQIVERQILFDWLDEKALKISAIIHLGARTDTTEFNYEILEELNVDYSKDIWNYCTAYEIPLIYASSAATYGSGEEGYDDSHEVVEKLSPLNPYGVSKNEFDKWVLLQKNYPPYWAGLKFFNVYGPNEYHKGRMASVIFHSARQIRDHGFVKLFQSHKPDYADGEQLRDFIYVKDINAVILWMLEEMLHQRWKRIKNGLYNVGTGKARSFKDLVSATFKALGKTPEITYIPMPEDIRNTYQYYTKAEMNKLFNAGYQHKMHSLEEGITDYVSRYLKEEKYY
ncbi:MAG: ADP-glyceromanno-heptose 6-epimerase [Bacteroidetes bacterium]|nr:ADP-glyceromanno-heptose 6-epimerase [Bacteroidota bacterium]